MLERLNVPVDAFSVGLGAALKMENTVLEVLGELEEKSQRQHLKRHLRHHAEETREQIVNLERAFSALGEEPDENPCPAIEAIEQKGRANLKRADDVVVDAVILWEAAEIERHEIAVYEDLITEAEAMRKRDIAQLLRRNLDQERRTLEEVEHGRHASAGARLVGT